MSDARTNGYCHRKGRLLKFESNTTTHPHTHTHALKHAKLTKPTHSSSPMMRSQWLKNSNPNQMMIFMRSNSFCWNSQSQQIEIVEIPLQFCQHLHFLKMESLGKNVSKIVTKLWSKIWKCLEKIFWEMTKSTFTIFCNWSEKCKSNFLKHSSKQQQCLHAFKVHCNCWMKWSWLKILCPNRWIFTNIVALTFAALLETSNEMCAAETLHLSVTICALDSHLQLLFPPAITDEIVTMCSWMGKTVKFNTKSKSNWLTLHHSIDFDRLVADGWQSLTLTNTHWNLFKEIVMNHFPLPKWKQFENWFNLHCALSVSKKNFHTWFQWQCCNTFKLLCLAQMQQASIAHTIALVNAMFLSAECQCVSQPEGKIPFKASKMFQTPLNGIFCEFLQFCIFQHMTQHVKNKILAFAHAKACTMWSNSWQKAECDNCLHKNEMACEHFQQTMHFCAWLQPHHKLKTNWGQLLSHFFTFEDECETWLTTWSMVIVGVKPVIGFLCSGLIGQVHATKSLVENSQNRRFRHNHNEWMCENSNKFGFQ